MVVTALTQLELTLSADGVEGSMPLQRIAFAVMTGAIALRRTSPVAAVLVCSLGLAGQTFVGVAPAAGGYLAFLFLLGSLGWHGSLRSGLAGVAGALAGGLVYDFVTPDFRLGDLLVNALIIIFVWLAAWMLRVTSDRRVRAEVDADRKAREAAHEERSRIARDLHDSTAHALTLITLQAGSARERSNPDLSDETLASIERTGREALADMHRFLDLLGPADGDAPGIADLPDLVDRVGSGGLSVGLDVSDVQGVPLSVSTTVYRVVQEALTNVVRHSSASTASVVVRREAGAVVAEVTDDGHGRPPTVPGSGRGLASLRERLRLFDGTLDAAPSAEGWQLRAWIPVVDG